MTSTILEAALDYAKRGWLVLPLYTLVDGRCTCWARDECKSPGKHPLTHNIQVVPATTDVEKLRQLFVDEMNIGIRCGEASGIAVLDVDPRNGGDESLGDLLDEHGPLPDTVEVATGGGGRHFYFAITGPLRTIPEVASGVELRGDAANVVAPPSLHASGERYEWVRSPDDIEPAEMPAWLLPAKMGKSHTNGSVSGIIPQGKRNNTLTSSAGKLRAAGSDEPAILAALQSENRDRCQPMLSNAELESIARSVARYRPMEHLTDLGNAWRLVAEHGADLRFCYPYRWWYVWDGRQWARDETAEVVRRAKETVAGIYIAASKAGDEDTRKALAKHAIRSEGEARLSAMAELAKSEPGIPVLPEELDRGPMLLNVANGTLDLRTAELRPPRRGDLLTRLIDIPYDTSAACPTWQAFLRRIFRENDSLIGFVQRAVGYSLTGDTGDHVLFFLHGAGANGKSTLLNTLLVLLGPYGRQIESDLLMVRRSEVHPTGLSDLEGSRLAVAMEIEDGRRLAESLVKAITGGDRLTARRMHKDFREFWPTHKLWLGANHRPVVRGTDNAIWRRIRLIPFDVTIPPGEQDRFLSAKLREELPGILTWAVYGCLEWAAEGLGVPEEVRVATDSYRAEQDILSGFLDECCIQQPSASVGSTKLAEAYREWTGTQLSQKALAQQLQERGFERTRKSSGVRWVGLTLLEDR